MSVIVLGDYLLGKWELLKVASRGSTTDLTDTSITAGTFGTADFSALSGTDIAALVLYVRIIDNAATDSAILAVREVGDTLSSTVIETQTARISAQIGAQAASVGLPMVIPARGTAPGQFQYTALSTTHPINSLIVHYWGRIRP